MIGLDLSMDDVKSGQLIFGNPCTTLNVTTGTSGSTLHSIQAQLTLLTGAVSTRLETVTVTGAAGIKADLSGLFFLTAIDARAPRT